MLLLLITQIGLLKTTKNKKKKHDKILMVAKSQLNSIETLVSKALIDTEISQRIQYDFKRKR